MIWPLSINACQGVGRYRHQARHRPTVVGDFESFASQRPFQIATGLLAQVADTGALHRATAWH
jgi:hypothetical protein